MTTGPSATGVRTYHTLASVAGAPHEAFSCASSASVVASVVLSTSLNGTETTVAPENTSLLGTDAGITSSTGGAGGAGLLVPSLHAATASASALAGSANRLIGTSRAKVPCPGSTGSRRRVAGARQGLLRHTRPAGHRGAPEQRAANIFPVRVIRQDCKASTDSTTIIGGRLPRRPRS